MRSGLCLTAAQGLIVSPSSKMSVACDEEGQGSPIRLNTSKQTSSFECEEIYVMEVNQSRVCEGC